MRLLQKAGMVGIGALSVLGGLGVPASPAGAQAEAQQIGWLSVGGETRIKDDEVIARRDKYCNRAVNASAYGQLPTMQAATASDTDNKCGGEVRVEFHVTGRIDGNGQWCTTGNVDLYEGTKDTNHDLDGSVTLERQCAPLGSSVTYSGRVENDDEGGDWATYSFDVLAIR